MVPVPQPTSFANGRYTVSKFLPSSSSDCDCIQGSLVGAANG